MPRDMLKGFYMTSHIVKVNRAPVMTLWADVVAERLGFDRDEALTLGRAVAGLNAQAKGQRLGIFQPAPESVKRERAQRKPQETFHVDLLGRSVPVRNTPEGIRASPKTRSTILPASNTTLPASSRTTSVVSATP